MQRGLEGRRIALLGSQGQDAIGAALEAAGATIARLDAGSSGEDQWHSGLYAALVVAGGTDPGERGRQLVREFLVADKPVAAIGDGIELLRETGALEGRTLAGEGSTGAGGLVADENLLTAATMPPAEFAAALAREFSQRLEEHDLDEMSDQSFPASDPPSGTPASVGARRDVRPEGGAPDRGESPAR